MSTVTVSAPFDGWLTALGAVPDPVFADGMMGEGVAIEPLEGIVRAPCDAAVIAVAPTGHSVTLALANGAELLIHVGIDTVALAGSGFAAKVAAGDRVVAGQVLIVVDLDLVAEGSTSLATPIVVVNPGFDLTIPPPDRRVEAGARLFDVVAVAVGVAHAPSPATAHRELSQTLTIGLAHGLHARPAARLAAALKPYAAEVLVEARGSRANARSPVALMAMATRRGDAVTILASGEDAASALAAAAALVAGADSDDEVSLSAPAPTRPGGVCASPGLAVGPVALFQAARIEVARDGSGPAVERARLAAARRRAAAGLGTGPIEAAHRALIEDPELAAIADAATAAGRSAGFAWRHAADHHAELLRRTGDARAIERIDDLRDVTDQVLLALGGTAVASDMIPPGSILVAAELLPSQFVAIGAAERAAGICLAGGGPTSHVAVLAASAGIPMVVSAGPSILGARDGELAILDAAAATLELAPTAGRLDVALADVAARTSESAARLAAARADCRLADGTRVEVFANLASVADAHAAIAVGAEGCGLLRSEFLFLDRATPPGVDEQRLAYQAIADALGDRPLIIRTLDIGGDKPVAYLPQPAEDNPALGARGIRLGLARPALLTEQLAAILAVEPAGRCRIMVPMIVDIAELRAVRAALDSVRGDRDIALGVMIETPSAALLADQLAAEADFLSIGTNDLTQYALAADRGNPATAAMIDALHPAVLRLIAQAAAGAALHSRPLGVCGGAAGDPLAAAILVGLGVTELSSPPALIPAIKAALSAVTLARCQSLATAALACGSAAEVRAMAAGDLALPVAA